MRDVENFFFFLEILNVTLKIPMTISSSNCL